MPLSLGMIQARTVLFNHEWTRINTNEDGPAIPYCSTNGTHQAGNRDGTEKSMSTPPDSCLFVFIRGFPLPAYGSAQNFMASKACSYSQCPKSLG